MAIAAGVKPIANDATGQPDSNTIVPVLFDTQFPDWFAGRRVRGHRHRRAGAGGDHVDRRGQPVDPQHLQGVPQARRHPAAGGPAGQARLAGGQVRRGAVRPVHRPAVLHRPAAHRRRDHPADAARGGDRASTPAGCTGGALIAGWVVGMGYGLYLLWLDPQPGQRQGALRRLGAHARQAHAVRLAPVRGLAGADLRRLRRAGGQPGRRGAGHPGLAGGPRGRGRGRHPSGRLPRRRGLRAVAPGSQPRWREPPTEPFRTATNDHWTAPRYRSARPVCR